MKRSIKRYTLVLEGNLEKRRLFSRRERVEYMYDKIREYNSKKSNPYFIVDLKFNGKTRTLFYRKYIKTNQNLNLKIWSF